MSTATKRWTVLLFTFSLIAAACGSSSDDTTTTTVAATESTTTTSTTAATTTTTELSGAVTGLKGVQAAVVRITAEGSFVDPEYGAVANVEGSGSGFIIDPSGIAVTNNHVVTGAAFLQVYVDGEDEPRNAKILGVSECSDLAVIDIDGAGFPYLEWYEGPIEVGQDLYAAGFPDGDPEYALLEGIVSKAKSDGDTYWASVDYVIEHTAPIVPGNSGGPLVTPEGTVLGVVYRFNEIAQHAISREEADRVLPELIAGNDVNSIGVNGYAFTTEDLSGMWVSAVASGSPVADAGIKGGDIITELEGLIVSTDGTMADYCDILRSHDAEDPLAIEVLRVDTEEVLEGTLNSDEELVLAFSFADEFAEDDGTDTGDDTGTDDTTTAYEYVEIWDDTGQLVMQVPATWNDVESVSWTFQDSDEGFGPALIASPDIDGMYDYWSTPGVWFSASNTLAEQFEPGAILDSYDDLPGCTYDGRYDYSDPLYTGMYDLWTDCGGDPGNATIDLEARPESGAYVVRVYAQVASDADWEALDVILDTFQAVTE